MFYKEEKRDLFSVSDSYYLVQCISADFAMGALYDDAVCKSTIMRLSNKDFHVLHQNFNVKISDKCCDVMKKKPFAKYTKDNE